MSINFNWNKKTGSGREKAGYIYFLIFLVLISAGSCGCIKIMQQSVASNDIQNTDVLHTSPARTIAPVPSINAAQKSLPSNPTLPVTATTPGLVTDAAPVLPPDPYPMLHGMQINETSQTTRHLRYAEFTRTYVLRGNATGLVVNATVLEGPLRIWFDVKPLYDCLEDPESCRGDLAKPVNRPYFTLTVRDNQTRFIVAEDGFGREFSSQKDNRVVKLYGEGQYHLTLTGNSVDVTLSVATGAAPPVSDIQSPPVSPALTKAMSPEYLRYLRESGGVV